MDMKNVNVVGERVTDGKSRSREYTIAILRGFLLDACFDLDIVDNLTVAKETGLDVRIIKEYKLVKFTPASSILDFYYLSKVRKALKNRALVIKAFDKMVEQGRWCKEDAVEFFGIYSEEYLNNLLDIIESGEL